MKRLIFWCLGLLAAMAVGLWWGYEQRNFALILLGLAFGLVALAVALKPARTLFTMLVSLVLALALAEFALGLLQPAGGGVSQAYFDPTSEVVQPYWNKSDIGSIPRPGQHHSRETAPGGRVIYEASYGIGEDGFRITPGNPAKASARVNFLGCSITFGEGLNDDQSLPAQVQKRMPDVLVKNFGIHGYGMHQALAILESSRDTSGRINVAMTIPWHAERSACIPVYSLGTPRYALQADGSVRRDGVCGGIEYFPLARALSLSRIYGLVKAAVQARQGQDGQIDLYLGLIRQMARISESRQQQLVVGFYKAQENWFTGSYSNARILQAFKDMKLEVVDLTLAPTAESVDAKYKLDPLDEHPSALANAARSALMQDMLQRKLAR